MTDISNELSEFDLDDHEIIKAAQERWKQIAATSLKDFMYDQLLYAHPEDKGVWEQRIWVWNKLQEQSLADAKALAFWQQRAMDFARKKTEERGRFSRLIAWCRPRLSKDVYRTSLDEQLANPRTDDGSALTNGARGGAT